MVPTKIFEALTDVEQRAIEEMRDWSAGQGIGDEFLTVAGKLAIVRRAIEGSAVGPSDAWKLNALGVLFGDALTQAMEDRLRWVVAEDGLGPAYALSWKHTEVLIYPLSAIRSRVQDGLPVDVHAMFHEISSILPFHQR